MIEVTNLLNNFTSPHGSITPSLDHMYPRQDSASPSLGPNNWVFFFFIKGISLQLQEPRLASVF